MNFSAKIQTFSFENKSFACDIVKWIKCVIFKHCVVCVVEYKIGISYNIVVDIDDESHDAYSKGRKVHSLCSTNDASRSCIIARHWRRCTLK